MNLEFIHRSDHDFAYTEPAVLTSPDSSVLVIGALMPCGSVSIFVIGCSGLDRAGICCVIVADFTT